MSATRALQAEWAILGKLAGDTLDYRVIDSSRGSADDPRFEAQIRAANPGTPQMSGEGRADALPWITFDAFTDQDIRWSGIAVKEWSGAKDASGRPIAQTRYFVFPYAKGAETVASYGGMYDAVVRMGSAPPRKSPATLDVRPFDPEVLADRVEARGPGFAWYAAVAALVMDGPVALTGAGGLSPAERVEQLEAVVALLPYGLRAALRVSTWVDNLADHAARLFFCEWARKEHQREVRWEVVPEIPEGTIGHAYLSALHGARATSGGTASVVHHLMTVHEPLTFGDGALLEVVDGLRPVATQGTPVFAHDPADVSLRDGAAADGQRDALLAPSFGELPDGRRAELLRTLITRSEPEDVMAMATRWREVRGQVVRVARAELAAGRIEPARGCLEAAARNGQTDAYVARLLEAESPISREETRYAVEFLYRCEPPAPESWPDARAVVLNQPQLVHRLLHRHIRDGRGDLLTRWLAWMADHERAAERPPAWLVAFARVGQWSLPPLRPDDVAAVTARFDAGGVVTLLELAALAEQLDAVLPALWPPLARLALNGQNSEASSRAHDVLGRIGGTLPAQQAALDLLLLLFGSQPAWASGVRTREQSSAYLAGFQRMWATPELDGARDTVAESIAEAVSGRRELSLRLSLVDPAIRRAIDARLGPLDKVVHRLHAVHAWSRDLIRVSGDRLPPVVRRGGGR